MEDACDVSDEALERLGGVVRFILQPHILEPCERPTALEMQLVSEAVSNGGRNFGLFFRRHLGL